MSRICTSAILLLALLSGASTAGGVPCLGGQGSWASGSTPQARRPDWLVRHDEVSWQTGRSSLPPGHVIGVPASGTTPLYQASSTDALPFGPGAPERSAWRQAGVYGLEFGGALVGTSVAALAARSMISLEEDKMWLGLAAFPTYAVSSAFLSTAGTCLVGKCLGQGGSFGHALVGGALGGLCGSASYFFYLSSPGRDALAPLAVILPPLCAVVIYNVWRNSEPR